MELFEHVLSIVEGLLFTFVLARIWWKLCHTIDVDRNVLERGATDIDGECDYAGEFGPAALH